MKSLKTRLLTAVIGIPFMLVLLFFGNKFPIILSIATSLVTGIMAGEYLNAKKLLNKYFLSIPCILFAAFMPIIVATKYTFMALVLFMFIMSVILLLKHEKLNYIDFAYSMFGMLLITFGMSMFSALCLLKGKTIFFFVTTFALPWMADAGGFFIGANFGKKKLCPQISPKKSVEGAFGGAVFCMISAVLIGIIFNICYKDFQFNFALLILIGLLDSIFSIVGDLTFSVIKRSLNIKDYSSIFPGHGGMLDRFDSIIFTVPILYVINMYFPLIVMSVA